MAPVPSRSVSDITRCPAYGHYRDGDEDRSGGHGGMIARLPPDAPRHEVVADDDDLMTLHDADDPFARDLRRLRGHGRVEAPRP